MPADITRCEKCGGIMHFEWGNAGERYVCDNCGNVYVMFVRVSSEGPKVVEYLDE